MPRGAAVEESSMRKNVSVLLLVLFASTVTFAQTSGSGTITGTLTDPSGAVVPGGDVSITNTDTGIERKTTSNEAGIYNVTFLRPGHYEVGASKTGFTSVLRKE